ncbi:hypothetical protein JF535_04275 [Microbulbifer salipaludis]|uniref:Uncharacterized protein n=1 Tax=Microbulbifer salipaludis TaxID=187980 RepID=A0ABS3E435_9GAMM|nr:hypothetical protein [Microbulbifer salipaludis]MBN8430066.1 hypothetical protein [Microbulbifer salipaludis]
MSRKYFGLDEYKKDAHSVWFRSEDVSELAQIMINDFGKEPDVLSALDRGKEWLFKDLCRLQPKTGGVLMEGGDLFIGGAWPLQPPKKDGLPPRGKLYLYLEVQGQLIQIGVPRPSIIKRQTMADDLPLEVRDAYYCKGMLDGLALVEDVIPPLNGRLLPMPVACGWSIIQHWAERLKVDGLLLRKIVESLELEQDSDGNHYGLRAFLVQSPTGSVGFSDSDVLFLHRGRRQIIHMKNGDFLSMRILDSYSEAIDEYCAHTISRRAGRFSFDPYLAQGGLIA